MERFGVVRIACRRLRKLRELPGGRPEALEEDAVGREVVSPSRLGAGVASAACSHRTIRALTIAVLAVLGAACATPHRTAVTDVSPLAWCDEVEIPFENADTLSLLDLSIFLRCNNRFAEDTLTVRIGLRTPDSLRCEEPFILAVPRVDGPAALVREAVVPYRRRVRLDRSGRYVLSVAPSRCVRGVEAVGVDIVERME